MAMLIWDVYIFVVVQWVVLMKGNIFSSEVSSVHGNHYLIYNPTKTTTRLIVYCVPSLSKIYYSVNHGEHPLTLCRGRVVIVITAVRQPHREGRRLDKQPYLSTVIRRGN